MHPLNLEGNNNLKYLYYTPSIDCIHCHCHSPEEVYHLEIWWTWWERAIFWFVLHFCVFILLEKVWSHKFANAFTRCRTIFLVFYSNIWIHWLMVAGSLVKSKTTRKTNHINKISCFFQHFHADYHWLGLAQFFFVTPKNSGT